MTFETFTFLAFKLLLITSLIMTGIIWYVQVIQYPLFKKVGKDHFLKYERAHVQRSGILIAPIMLAELISTLFLLFRYSDSLAIITATLLLAVIWISTFFIQVPIHRQLKSKFDMDLIDKLVNTNWTRTVAWTAKSCLLLFVEI